MALKLVGSSVTGTIGSAALKQSVGGKPVFIKFQAPW